MSRKIWNHPEGLTNLLTELPEPAEVNPQSQLIFVSEELGTLTLKGAEVGKVLASVDTVEQLFEALDRESSVRVELSNFEADSDVLETMESRFDYFESV